MLRITYSLIMLSFIMFMHQTVNCEDVSIFDPDGYITKRDTGFKLGYIAGFVAAKSDVDGSYFSLAHHIIEKLQDEKAISKNFDKKKLQDIWWEIVKKHVINDSYDGIPFDQLASGVDDFYSDSTNMKIILHDALDIVKQRIKGEKEAVIKCQIEYYRMKASGADYDKQRKKVDECSKRR